MRRDLLDAVLAAKAARRTVAIVTALDTGAQTLIDGERRVIDGGLSLTEADWADVAGRLGRSSSGILEGGEGRQSLFVDVHCPLPRLVVVGAVHIAQILLPMAVMVGYDVVLVDPRAAFASPERFPGITVIDAWPDEALAALSLDEHTAVVTLTHDPKLDDPALTVALRAPVFYIGALGSRVTHAKRVEWLRGRDFESSAIARIHAPIGLPIGGRGPAEIALSILAEVTATRRGAPMAGGSG